MNYEEKYNVALEKARELSSCCINDRDRRTKIYRVEDIESIFPELKESEDSEDKRISKEITQFLKQKNGWNREWLTWLEKQGEQPIDKIEANPAWSEEDEEMLTWLCRIIHSQKLDRAITLKEESELGEWIDKWLNHNSQTKQSEKPEGKSALNAIKKEKVDNQNCIKPYEDVEPKFHPGDWVIDNCGGIYQIESAAEIIAEHIFGYTIVGGGYFNDNNDVRLWTIDDAKCGDVLISPINKQPFVYNGNYTSNSLGAYFGLNYKGELLICDSHGNNWTGLTSGLTCVQPATEEQCNMLFKKLHDSDYKWDSEKKELWHKYL